MLCACARSVFMALCKGRPRLWTRFWHVSPGVCVPACFSGPTSDKPASAVPPGPHKSYLQSSERHFASDVFLLSFITSSLSLPPTYAPYLSPSMTLFVCSFTVFTCHVLFYPSCTPYKVGYKKILLPADSWSRITESLWGFKLVRKYKGGTCLDLVEVLFI